MSCRVSCKGFLSVRAECARDACLAMDSMCHVLSTDISDCSSWCCTNRGWYIFFMVIFFGAGTFALCSAFYLYRLHQFNVMRGAVTDEGQIVDLEPSSEFNSPPPENETVEKALVSPEIIKRLKADI